MAPTPIESLTTQASGSVGPVVYSHNQHGPYTRVRTLPADPNTALQGDVRNALAECVTAWNAALTQPERDTWHRYALACRLSSPIGRQTHVGGLGMYVRSNVPRIQAAEVSLPRVDVAPAFFDLGGDYNVRRCVLNYADDVLHVLFDDTSPWVAESGAALLIYVSRPQPLTINFWKGPYRYAGCLLGGSPATFDPYTLPLPFAAAPNERVFVRGRLTRADGRLSSSFRLPADYAPGPVPNRASFFGTPLFQCYVFWDQDLVARALLPTPWSVRDAGFRHTARTALSERLYVLFVPFRPQANPGVNAVTYAPAHFHVVSAVTGIPAASFVDFPTS